jgi:hypothetical protein
MYKRETGNRWAASDEVTLQFLPAPETRVDSKAKQTSNNAPTVGQKTTHPSNEKPLSRNRGSIH